MNSSRMQDLVQKARDLALDGDYTSSLVYYEEWKEQFERANGFSPLPSQKRLYDTVLSELTELKGLIAEIKNLSHVSNPSVDNDIQKSGHKNPDSNLTSTPKRINKTTTSSAPRPRFTVDERGHKLSGGCSSPVLARMTAPVRRQSIQTTKIPVTTSDTSRSSGSDIGSDTSRFENSKTELFVQQYKGVIDLDLVRMLEAEVIDHSPHVTWDQIAGLQQAREVLEEAFILPQWIPNLFQGIRRPWKGILLFGPPGTGKTMLAKAIATECNTTFFNVTSSTLTSKWRGESEKLVKLLFEMAQFYAPSTVFIDEVDALGGQRGNQGDNEASLRVKSELLIQMDGIASSENGGVTVLGATNLPWNLDEALRRRFEKRIYIPLPDKVQRKELFEINLRSIDMDETVDLDLLAEKTQGYSGADITNVCRDASMMSVRSVLQQLRNEGVVGRELQKVLRDREVNLKKMPITQTDLIAAIEKVSSSVGSTDICNYENWMKEFGSV